MNSDDKDTDSSRIYKRPKKQINTRAPKLPGEYCRATSVPPRAAPENISFKLSVIDLGAHISAVPAAIAILTKFETTTRDTEGFRYQSHR
jgi:hypothetical protein